MNTGIQAAAAAMLFAAAAVAHGAYPEKAIRIVVPYAPGGNIDITARTIAPGMSEALGVQVVIDNRAGAGGMIGSEMVARATPDGYTLLMGSTGALSTAVALYPKIRFDPIKDFAPTSAVAVVGLAVVVHPAIPARSIREFIALAKSRPGRVTMASSGTGTSNHLAGEYFQTVTGTKMVHIPYKGSGPALIDVMGGQVDVLFDQVNSSLGYIQGGRIKALAVTTPRRSAVLPDVPTLDESGLKGFDASTTTGILLPAAAPQDIVTKVHAAVVRTLRQPAVRDSFLRLGAEVRDGTPEDFTRTLISEAEKWTKVVRAANVKLD